MGELTPVNEIDGRKIENKKSSEIQQQLYVAFKELISQKSEPI